MLTQERNMTHDDYEQQLEDSGLCCYSHVENKTTSKMCLTVQDAIDHLSTFPKDMMIMAGTDTYIPVIGEWMIKELPHLKYVFFGENGKRLPTDE